MNTRQLAQVGLGLIGVMALVYALSGLSAMAAMGAESQGSAFSLIIGAVPLAALGILSYVLVFYSGRVATAIIPNADAATERSSTDVGRILVALLGVYILVQAIPSALSAALTFPVLGEFAGSERTEVTARLVGLAVQIAIALYLIARPERLLDYVQRPLRAAPLP